MYVITLFNSSCPNNDFKFAIDNLDEAKKVAKEYLMKYVLTELQSNPLFAEHVANFIKVKLQNFDTQKIAEMYVEKIQFKDNVSERNIGFKDMKNIVLYLEPTFEEKTECPEINFAWLIKKINHKISNGQSHAI